MRILVLATETPLPARSGVRQRILHLARRLATAADVEVVALGEPEAVPGEAFRLTHVPHRRSRALALAASLRRPYMQAKLESRGLAEAAARTGWSTVQAEFPYTVPAARHAGAPVVLDAHNVEAELLATLSREDPRVAHRLRWGWEARKTERLERRAVALADAVCATSDDDAAVLEAWGAREVVVVPNGVDTAAVPHRPPAGGGPLLYVGHFGYRPNVLAAEQLVQEVLPGVRERVPSATVRLVGLEAERRLARLVRPGVEVFGDVDSVVPHLHEAGAFVVPLRSGGGTRLKVLEAMAAGAPVVSTPFGVAGLDVRDGRHVDLAEPADLAPAAARLLLEPDTAARRSSAARELVERRYDWSVVAEPLIELHRRLGAGAS